MFQAALEKLFVFGSAGDIRVDEKRAKFQKLRTDVWQAAAAESLPYPAALGVVFMTGNLIYLRHVSCVEIETWLVSAYTAAFAGSGSDRGVAQANAGLDAATVMWLLCRYIKFSPSSAPEGVSQELIDAVAEHQNAPCACLSVQVDSLTTEQLIAAAFDFDSGEDEGPHPRFALELVGRPDCAPAIALAAAYLLLVWEVNGSRSPAELAKLIADKFRGVSMTLMLPPVIV